MTSVSAREAESFLTTPAKHFFVLLFHGADPGLVKERAREAVRRNTPDLTDPFSVVRLSPNVLIEDPMRLLDEVNTLTPWSDSRSIWIDATGRQSLDGLETALQTPLPATQIIIEAGELRADAQILKVCTSSRNAVAIECSDSQADVEHLIDEMAQKNGLTLSEVVRSALVGILTSDRSTTRSELDKLALYATGKSSIELDDIQAVVSGGESISPELVVEAALSGNFDKLARAWKGAQTIGLDGPTVLGFALRRLLYQRPNAFRPGNSLDGERTAVAIRSLATAIKLGRQEPRLANALALRALWSIARLSGARRPTRQD
jgi:DNA polymerase III subunit delta